MIKNLTLKKLKHQCLTLEPLEHKTIKVNRAGNLSKLTLVFFKQLLTYTSSFR